MKSIAIIQSNYIPWKGYFDIINCVDEFIIYDCVQYTKNDWRNRNKIYTSNGLQWLTIPVKQEKLTQKINETYVANDKWRIKHWRSLTQNYSKAPYFKNYKEVFEELYLGSKEQKISAINLGFIYAINKILGITTPIRFCEELSISEGQTQRLIDICKACNADTYVSGPSADSYFDLDLAKKEGLTVKWMDYSNYQHYSQLHQPFENFVSIIDLIFNQGDNAHKYLKSTQAV